MKKQLDYLADYRMDILKKGSSRVLWIHKDEQEQQQQLKLLQTSHGGVLGQSIKQLVNRPYV